MLYWRRCVVCGREFFGGTARALVCSPGCNQRRWRAVVMLAGTHGYDARGKLRRIEQVGVAKTGAATGGMD